MGQEVLCLQTMAAMSILCWADAAACSGWQQSCINKHVLCSQAASQPYGVETHLQVAPSRSALHAVLHKPAAQRWSLLASNGSSSVLCEEVVTCSSGPWRPGGSGRTGWSRWCSGGSWGPSRGPRWWHPAGMQAARCLTTLQGSQGGCDDCISMLPNGWHEEECGAVTESNASQRPAAAAEPGSDRDGGPGGPMGWLPPCPGGPAWPWCCLATAARMSRGDW